MARIQLQEGKHQRLSYQRALTMVEACLTDIRVVESTGRNRVSPVRPEMPKLFAGCTLECAFLRREWGARSQVRSLNCGKPLLL